MSAVTIALIILSLVVFSFNNVCVLKIVLSKRLRKKVSHIAICSLLFAHDLQGLIVIPAFALKRLERQDHGINCDIFRFSYMFTNYGACISLLLITMDRMFAVFYPLKHYVKWTIKKALYSVCLGWLYVLCLCLVPFFTPRNKGSCLYKPQTSWTIFMLSFNTLVPFLIMNISYIMMYVKIRRSHKKLRNCSSMRTRSQRKHFKTALSIVVSFLLCWGPSFIYYFILAVCKGCQNKFHLTTGSERILTFLMKFLTFIDGVTAPLIYCVMNKTFRNDAGRKKSEITTMRNQTIVSRS